MGGFFLIGVQCCGKTTLGQRTADVLGMPFFERFDPLLDA